MTRGQAIELIIREIHAGFPSEDTPITDNLVNLWLNIGIGIAVQQNYKEGIALEGIGYVNNSFYTTFKGIAPVKDEQFLWSIQLPQIPFAIGRNEGINDLVFKSTDGQISLDAVPLSEAQRSYARTARPIPNKVLYYPEGDKAFVWTTLTLTEYTAQVTLISGGDSTDLDSNLNVPSDYMPAIIDYCVKRGISQLRGGVKDGANDGEYQT